MGPTRRRGNVASIYRAWKRLPGVEHVAIEDWEFEKESDLVARAL
ncbi:hypothetical protein AKJ08_2736 [Vulgatibacter incomptus]|uniref:Uncharacterized protein n=1 Tax=Vulgatibacter incomptus TaxID=1391653 RepID=A0A0K1PGV4_9BACT|nr:hypothetical protein AKJ08_2736 [Vulgatibacter incomptus]